MTYPRVSLARLGRAALHPWLPTFAPLGRGDWWGLRRWGGGDIS